MNKKRTLRSTIMAQIAAARARDDRERKAGKRAITARYEPESERVILELSNGYVFGFPVSAIPALRSATDAQLAAVEVSPGGGGLHWEELDADLSVPGLLLSTIGRKQKLGELARLAGSSRSAAKAAASRANGAKGGRPRKA